ncbi:MAG: hypothetical protein ACU836_18880 [Gammaproteobacteria bacterium]
MKKRFDGKKIGGQTLVCLALAMSQSAGAAVTAYSSNGYGAGVNLDVLNIPLLDVKLPDPIASIDSASAGVHDHHSTVNADVGATVAVGDVTIFGLNLLNAYAKIGLNAELVYGDASYDSVVSTVAAAGGVDNLDLGASLGLEVLSLYLPKQDVLDLGNVTLESSASVMDDHGILTPLGDSSVLGLGLGLKVFGNAVSVADLGLSVDANGYIKADPNTVIDIANLLNLTGISLTLNEQLVNDVAGGACSAGSCSMEVNALHLAFKDFALGTALLNGDIILGHSYAEMSAVPVPAAAWLFGSAIVGLISFGRRRQLDVLAER